MKDRQITRLSAAKLSALLRRRELSAVEAAEAYLSEIESCDPEIGAYLAVTADTARARAAAVDAARLRGEELPPLAGVPVALKDNICTRFAPTTCASRMLEGFTPPYDAHVVERLEAGRMVPLGKCNMDEFAMGSTTESSFFQITRNPADPSRVPGGSSGGSAAAVAACEAPCALGSDTGGSIRQPAAFCGVVGMKPTYGAVSRYGLVAFASSLDQIGPLTRTVRDSALLLDVIAGHDPRDATSLAREWGSFGSQLGREAGGLRAALPAEFFGEGIAPEVSDAVKAAAARYERLGVRVGEVSLPTLRHALPAYYVLSSAEASSNLSRFDGVRCGFRAEGCRDIGELYRESRSQGFGAEVKRRILLGSFVLSAGYYDAYYKKALEVRTLVQQDFARVFERFDFLLAPVAPTTACRLGEKRNSPLEMYMGDVCTVPVNIAGLPALSMPCGTGAQGLPIGMQLIGRPFSEQLLYRAAYAYEQSEGGKQP
ncbi:Asp-tRNA(Asn)/Glu-tRNA(Gln) amidotransferase subunit GatA [Anaerotruncus massiliensis (ex Liu et al. 2021)]|uniref:Glutamyl-tRNA(Gln) amidotransferase subunit A n=2 Tax=Anaerotruncus TaxID=244127 RepID=A0A498CY32_9FIRM|nr:MULTISPECIES: Asp-tRNA(Asn)/Glu-tRNA(Gln) amidotransferase subunit GatA [Anaerotruncus]MBC3939611.1 Asp-tRNA(Asn)/Glu-tRNA(Gln) amidotransferase subunit GatA [Anaerotruncus massiliensis (ex Togo et al. 2019)]RLL08690.1 Asp-tRNA(Asn)/Glu-tRNA(Gln) amidotransferase subunit GatA [Anaerotruncus massiliensis (ex Liu et al. 2021)]